MKDSALIAALVAAVYALAEVVKYFVKQRSQKNGNAPAVSLHTEVDRQIRETYEDMKSLKREVVEVRATETNMAETLRMIAEVLKKTAETQEKVAATLDKIDRRQDIEEAVKKRLGENK